MQADELALDAPIPADYPCPDMFDEPYWPVFSFSPPLLVHSLSNSSDKVQGGVVSGQAESSGVTNKLNKAKPIRTNRNSHKTYHLIIKHWLAENGQGMLLQKYAPFFHKRVYFLLALDEALKHINGLKLAEMYTELAGRVIDKKTAEIGILDRCREGSEQAEHLKRLIDEINYSVEACWKFVRGEEYEAMLTVYCRGQPKLTKKKEFSEALHIFRQVTGREVLDLREFK